MRMTGQSVFQIIYSKMFLQCVLAILKLGWEYFAFLKGYIWHDYVWKN